MIHRITQAALEASKATIMAVTEAGNLVSNARQTYTTQNWVGQC